MLCVCPSIAFFRPLGFCREGMRRRSIFCSDTPPADVPCNQVAMLLAMLGNEHAAYWGLRYDTELASVRAALARGQDDPMEGLFVWFGKMAMLMACQLMQSEELGLRKEASVVLDLGCGNGFVCEVLHAMGFKKVIGVDYSPSAIRLALVSPSPRLAWRRPSCRNRRGGLTQQSWLHADSANALPLASTCRIGLGNHVSS